MAGSWIDIQGEDGGRFRGYLAVPAAGSGPGIVLIQEIFGVNPHIRDVADLYAEEGYLVLAPDLFWRQEPGVELGYDDASRKRGIALLEGMDRERAVADLRATVATLRARRDSTGKVGALGFCMGGTLAFLAAARAGVDAAVSYYGTAIKTLLAEVPKVACPTVLHFAAEDTGSPPEVIAAVSAACAANPNIEIHVYPGVGHAFNRPGPNFDKPASLMAHTRSIALFRRAMGPHYDLSALWDRHTKFEFGDRDVDATMATMVAEPYVNHVPTMTGGVGYHDLHRFYRSHFIPKTPKDTRLIPISRTIGTDRVVDEMLFCFTHDIEIDWMLPGVPPTGCRVEIPLVAIIRFHGDKLYNEHIYWDQASVLAQIGLLDPARLPIAGVETARKLVDESLPSNTLMARWAGSAPAAE